MFRFSTVVFLLALLALPATGYAYLDPGTGSMILQGLIAAIAVCAVTLKQYWHKCLSFFHRGNDKEEPDTPGPEKQQDA